MLGNGRPALRILGIDPGLRVTGFGIIEKNGASLAYIASGCINGRRSCRTVENHPRESAPRSSRSISRSRSRWRKSSSTSSRSTLALGQARGHRDLRRVDAGLPVAEYTALQVKQAVSQRPREKRARSRKW